MDVRLNSSSGLLFYVSNEKENSLMALSVSSGRLVLLVSIAGKKLKTRSREKYNDGQWHTVSECYSPGLKSSVLLVGSLLSSVKSYICWQLLLHWWLLHLA